MGIQAALWTMFKGINNWLPYSQSPRPYAIFRESVYSIMLRYLLNHPELRHIKAAVTQIFFQYYFLLFLFCSVTV